MAFLHFLLTTCLLSSISFVLGAVPSNTTIGTFGPLISYQPFNDWLYPLNHSIPIRISLGNGSLALSLLFLLLTDNSSFGFQLTYGISSAADPATYLAMDSLTVS